MKNSSKTKQEIIEELSALKKKSTKLEKSESASKEEKLLLQESEELYNSLFETSQDSIFIVNQKTGYFVSVNDSACRLYGYTKDEFYKMHHFDISAEPENSKNAVSESITHVPLRLHRKKDGTVFPVEITGGYILQGGRTLHTAFIRDITERKKAEAERLDSETKYRTLFESANDAIFLMDQDIFIDCNQKTLEMFGCTKEQIIGQPPYHFSPKVQPDGRNSREKALKNINTAMQGQPQFFEWKHCRYDGTLFDAEVSLSVFNDKGKYYIQSIVRDITERKQAENVVRHSEEKYRLSFENITDVLYTIDANLHISSVSPSVKGILGYKPEDFIGRPVSDLENILTPESFQQAITDTSMVLKGETIPVTVYQFIAKDGTIKYGEVSGSPLMRDGEIIGVISVARDITERKQVEDKLQQTLEILRKAVGATIQVLVSALEFRDPYTTGHQSRSADLARVIATEMGLAQDTIEGIRMAGIIHDIGKLSIPVEILSKPTKLTKLEFSLIQQHSKSGYEMLKDVKSPWPLAEIVYQHHERMDGSGYPRNLKGDEILMESRILAVADVVEAMASHRPYRPALGIAAALEEIEKNKGILYDDTVVNACLKLFRERGYQLK
jgi:PAS domain S-box-containing protein